MGHPNTPAPRGCAEKGCIPETPGGAASDREENRECGVTRRPKIKDGEDKGFMDDWYLDIRGVTGGESGALQMGNSVATKALR